MTLTSPPDDRATRLPDEDRLASLARRARAALAYLGEPPANWVPPREGADLDVAIIGGGQSGTALAFALHRAGIRNLAVYDRAPRGREGVWRDVARMRNLRSSKLLPGPEQGIAELTFQAWYEAAFGEQAYADLLRSPREVWADYVGWFRETVGIAVENGTSLTGIVPVEAGLRLELATPAGARSVVARKLVLATGMSGMGRPMIPAALSGLPGTLWAHTDDPIDFAALKGARIGVLGAASSAFDAAATALEAGAGSASLFSRHSDLVRITTIKGMAYPGVLDHFHELPDADRWSLLNYFSRRSAGPMPDTVERATRFANFSLHLAADWREVRERDGGVEVLAGGRRHGFDFVIVGTGYEADLAARPELAALAPHAALWRDRFEPPPGERNDWLGAFPYLGAGFELIERVPGRAPFLRDVHLFNFGGMVSHGRAVGEIASLKHGVPRLVSQIGRDLFLADRTAHLARLVSYATPDLTGAEYAAAIAR